MIRHVLALVIVAGPSVAAPEVTKDTNAPTAVPRDAPRAYPLSASKQQAIRQTRRTVQQRHDRAWADRERRAIHQERGAVLSGETR